MKFHIAATKNNLNIKHDEVDVFIYDLYDTADLTKFIQYISESDNLIECTPRDLNLFQEVTQDATGEMLKLVEYIYKIITAFNESYSAIYHRYAEKSSGFTPFKRS